MFPRIAASVGGMKVSNPDGFEGPYMIEAGELRGAVKWAPLLFAQRVEVHELAFVDASVSLQKKADGTTNWVLEKAPPSGEAPSEGGGFNGAVEHLRLENASLTYQDEQAGTRYELRELDLTAAMKALDKPLQLNAKGFFQSQRFDIRWRVCVRQFAGRYREGGYRTRNTRTSGRSQSRAGRVDRHLSVARPQP